MFGLPPQYRVSCCPDIVWIINPTHIKSNLLARPWTTICNQANIGYPNPIAKATIPICDNVLYATIFFTLTSIVANRPPEKRVKKPTYFITINIFLPNVTGLVNPINENPAVTKVDLCTSADVGVGALIALGNQPEKGICALLVIHTNKSIQGLRFNTTYDPPKYPPTNRYIPLTINKSISPTRIVKTVTIELLYLSQLWKNIIKKKLVIPNISQLNTVKIIEELINNSTILIENNTIITL